MSLDRKYLIFALSYAVAGMFLGIYMAASQNHGQLIAHTHILLVGFVTSFIYGIIHKLWLNNPGAIVAKAQFILHQLAAVILFVGLILFYGGVYPPETLDPILGAASVGVLIAALLMLYMAIKSGTGRT